MSSGAAPICITCKNFRGFKGDPGDEDSLPAPAADESVTQQPDGDIDLQAIPPAGTCSAFPDGIPMAILTNGHDHRLPWGNDNGIRWDPIPGHTGDATAVFGPLLQS